MTPRERAEEFGNKLFDYCKFGLSDKHRIDLIAWINGELSEAILADRQALQSELEKRLGWLRKQDCEKYIVYEETIDVIQSVFAQQSQSEKGKPHAFQGRRDRWCEICNQPDRAAIHKIQSSYRNESLPLDQSARIAAMHKWLAEDAQIIQQLNESNLKLKEENEKLTQKLSGVLSAMAEDHWMRNGNDICMCAHCQEYFGSTNRKA